MHILFDQGTPAPLRQSLTGHEVATAYERGWSNLDNGDLLAAAEDAGFDLFITTDQNLRYQQNLAARRLSVLVPPTTRWPQIRRHAADVVAAVGSIQPGGVSRIELVAGWSRAFSGQSAATLPTSRLARQHVRRVGRIAISPRRFR
jgi:hypothetical protein